MIRGMEDWLLVVTLYSIRVPAGKATGGTRAGAWGRLSEPLAAFDGVALWE
jgi:hypothetical protein